MSTRGEIDSFVEALRAVRTRRGREARGLFSLEGTRIVERAIRAPWPISSALVSERYASSDRTRAVCEALREREIPLVIAPDSVLEALVEGRTFGEILALAPRSERARPLSLPNRGLILGAVDIEDPGNTGALVRTAHAIGASAFLSIGVTQVFHPKAVRTSMGSVFRLPCFEFDALDPALAALPAGSRSFAASARADAEEIPGALRGLEFAGVACLLMGNEAHGLDDAAHNQIDHALRIPMPADTVDSFSVNAAAAILLYALRTRASS